MLPLAQLITGAHPATELIEVTALNKLALAVIYLLLGTIASFSLGVAVGGLVGAFRSLTHLFRSKTAWFAVITFALISYVGFGFAVGTLPIAGNLGDRTGYEMQRVMLVGAVIPGLFTWLFPISVFGIGAKELAMSQYFRAYAFVYGLLIFFVCGGLGLYMIFAYLTQALSPFWVGVSLLVYPLTFVIVPVVMIVKHGIWLPVILNLGGSLLGGLVMLLGDSRKKPGQ